MEQATKVSEDDFNYELQQHGNIETLKWRNTEYFLDLSKSEKSLSKCLVGMIERSSITLHPVYSVFY